MYEHTQRNGRIPVLFVLAALGVLASLFVLPPEVGAGPRLTLGATVLVLLATAFVFTSLTIRIDADHLAWHFGPGIIRKAVPLAAIASAEPTTTSALEGWGIHLTTRGWLNNVGGRKAVLVKLRDGSSFLLGTDEPDALAGAVRTALGPAH